MDDAEREAACEQPGRREDHRQTADRPIVVPGELARVEGRLAEDNEKPDERGDDEPGRPPPGGDNESRRSRRGRDDRDEHVTGLERDAGEDDRGREHAEDAGREDERLLEPAPVRLERRSDVGQERQDACLGGRDVGDGRRQPGNERCEPGRGDGGTGARIREAGSKSIVGGASTASACPAASAR